MWWCVLFVKQKTAYEMRISDWSSDVCSSDLLEQITGVETRRIHVDKGYRGHDHPHRFRVWISGQARRVTKPIRREMKRRAAIEPEIGRASCRERVCQYG